MDLKKSWNKFISEKPNQIFIGIFILGILLRIYYFWLTRSQPLWWDESDYMAYAKTLAGVGNVQWEISPQHNSFLPFLVALFFKFGFSEPVIKFILEIIPSIILIFLTYKVLLLMYKDSRIALISSFLITVFWNVLFNSTRFHLGIPSMLFAFLGIYVFFQGYEKREKIFGKINPDWAIPLAAFLMLVSYSIRKGYFLFGVFLFVYMFSTRNLKDLIKDKYNRIALIISVVTLFIIENFIFTSKITNVASSYYHPEISWSLDSFGVFGIYFNSLQNTIPTNILTYFFWIGFLLLLGGFFFYFLSLKKNLSSELKSDFFNLISIILTLGFFIFILRINNSYWGHLAYDPRWFFPLLLASLACISKSLILLSDYLRKYHKQLGIILILLVLGIGGYTQIIHSDLIIKNKIPSYSGIREAGLFLKGISSKEDIIISVPVPQTAYYSERNVLGPNGFVNKSKEENTLEDFLFQLRKNPNVKYIVVSFSEPNNPSWMRLEDSEYQLNPQTGQYVLTNWQIPFMDTKIDFVNQVQDIKQQKTYGEITFKLLEINQDCFIYEILRQ